jgi:hypothetical protein
MPAAPPPSDVWSGAAVGAVALALLVGPLAAPSQAHGLPRDPTRLRSLVTAITPQTPGLTVIVAPNGGTVTLTIYGSRTVTVLGPQAEPYIRLSSAGVEENRAILPPASLQLVRDLPPAGGIQAATDAPARWVQVTSTPTYTWRDGRSRWLNTDLASVPATLRRSHTLRIWRIPLNVDSQRVTIHGIILWTGQPLQRNDKLLVAVPLASTALALAGLLVLGATRRRRLRGQASAVGRTGRRADSGR